MPAGKNQRHNYNTDQEKSQRKREDTFHQEVADDRAEERANKKEGSAIDS